MLFQQSLFAANYSNFSLPSPASNTGDTVARYNTVFTMDTLIKDYDKILKKHRTLETNDPLDRLMAVVNEAKEKIRAGKVEGCVIATTQCP